jgi:hypothetical protein
VLPKRDFFSQQGGDELVGGFLRGAATPQNLSVRFEIPGREGRPQSAIISHEAAHFARVSVKVNLDIPLQKPHFFDE